MTFTLVRTPRGAACELVCNGCGNVRSMAAHDIPAMALHEVLLRALLPSGPITMQLPGMYLAECCAIDGERLVLARRARNRAKEKRYGKS